MLQLGTVKVLLLSVLLFIIGQSIAVADEERGFFLGIAGGASSFDDDGEFSGSGLDLDDSDSSTKVFFGYQFFRYLALELAYTDFGTYEFRNADGSGIENTAFSVAVMGIVPLADSKVDFYGKAGISIVDLDTTSSSFISNRDDTGGGIVLGLGLSYTPIENLSLLAGFDSHLYLLEVDRGFFTEDYWQSLMSTHIGLRLNF